MKLTQEEKAWILVDCGNSAYSMAITTALLPVIFGMFKNVNSSMDLGYFNSLACILVALLSPILGTIADYKNQKKEILRIFYIARCFDNRRPRLRQPRFRQLAIASFIVHHLSHRLRRSQHFLRRIFGRRHPGFTHG